MWVAGIVLKINEITPAIPLDFGSIKTLYVLIINPLPATIRPPHNQRGPVQPPPGTERPPLVPGPAKTLSPGTKTPPLVPGQEPLDRIRKAVMSIAW